MADRSFFKECNYGYRTNSCDLQICPVQHISLVPQAVKGLYSQAFNSWDTKLTELHILQLQPSLTGIYGRKMHHQNGSKYMVQMVQKWFNMFKITVFEHTRKTGHWAGIPVYWFTQKIKRILQGYCRVWAFALLFTDFSAKKEQGVTKDSSVGTPTPAQLFFWKLYISFFSILKQTLRYRQ